MNDASMDLFGYLGGTIMAVEGGYKVFPQSHSNRVFQRLADAKWFLALHWCEQFVVPAGILTNTGQFSFHNEAALAMGDESFIPHSYRPSIFKLCLPLKPLEGEHIIASLSPTVPSVRRSQFKGLKLILDTAKLPW